MSDELNLVHDLAVILISAGIFTIISKALKQPLVLGYVVAGFLVGPHVHFFPGISSTEVVSQWSEIGIIFLLFALGLEFSFKNLLKVGSGALIMAGCQCLGMAALGIMLGQAMGWNTIESIFLGAMLSVSSSTAIVMKAYDDLGLKNAPYASSVFGTLVVQDLFSVVLIVLLPTVALSQGFSGSTAMMEILKLLFFLVLWFLVGMYVIPTVLQKAKRYMTDEILLIISIGLCFAMVTVASLAGLSSALGAFVMGSILSETIEGEKIMKLVSSLKNLFAAVFFVSVGMMLDPTVIAEHWPVILALSLVVLVGIPFFATSGALLSGKGLDNSVHCGFSLAQMGEFPFILATLGISLGVLSDFIYPSIIAVSVITTFVTPYMIKASVPVSVCLRRKLPPRLVEKLDSNMEVHHDSELEKNEWMKLLKSQLLRVALYAVLTIAVIIGARMFLGKAVERLIPQLPNTLKRLLSVGITLALMLPFLAPMVSENRNIKKSAQVLLKRNNSNVLLLLALSISKLALAIVFIYTVIASQFEMNAAKAGLVICATVLIFFFFIKHYYHYFIRMEDRFMTNLNKKEEIRRMTKPVTVSVSEKLSSYNVGLEVVEVSADYPLIGKKLCEQPFRRESQVNIVKITRGSKSILIPSGDEPIYPHDSLVAVGTLEQLQSFVAFMKTSSATRQASGADFALESVVLDKDSVFTGSSLRELNLRASGCMIISVVRGSEVMTNPQSDFRFQTGDKLWIAGDNKAVSAYI